jgi:hypothetical protein
VQWAMDILIDRESQAAKARAAHEHMSDMDKVVLAQLTSEARPMSRRPEHIPRRKAFPKPVKAAVLQRSLPACARRQDATGWGVISITSGRSQRAETTVWTTVSFYVGRAMPPRASQRRRTPLSLIGRVDAAGNTQGATAPRPTARTGSGPAGRLRAEDL